MRLTIELELEEEGRWIAEVTTLPGVMVYGATREEALSRVKSLALARISDMIAHEELVIDNVIEFEPTGPRPRRSGCTRPSFASGGS